MKVWTAALAPMIAVAMALAGCKASAHDERCGRCGMKVDKQSAFRTETRSASGEMRAFDSPKCALSARKSGEALVVQDYYSRQTRVDEPSMRFVAGSDVMGPMGRDLIPVLEADVAKFRTDHGGTKTLKAVEIPAEKAMDLAEP